MAIDAATGDRGVMPHPDRVPRPEKSRAAVTPRRVSRLIVPLTVVVVLVANVSDSSAQPPAQSSPAEGRVQYDASFYAPFSPRTALDMVNHTPGFVLASGDTDERRGFEGAVANVLIDGERPIAKRQTITEVLQRVPAARVARIEILRGSDTAGDASGQTVVANVVLLPSRRYGVWSGGFELAGQRRPAPNGFISTGGRFKANDYALNASSYSLFRELPGMRTRSDESGAAATSAAIDSPRHYHEYAINGQVVRPVNAGRLEITAKAEYSRYHDDTSFRSMNADSASVDTEAVPYAQRTRLAEGGASYRRAVAGWDVTGLAFVSRRSFQSDVTATRSTTAGIQSIVAQTSSRGTGESILRLTLMRDRAPHRIQLGIEGTFNTLDGMTHLTLDIGDGPFALPVPNADVRVSERRAEVFASETWQSDGGWSAEGRLGFEISRLAFTGDMARAVDLAYLKPSVRVTRTLANRYQLHGRIARIVGQLDFADFVSVASLADNQLTGGNPDLRPPSSWRGELGMDVRVGSDAAVNAAVFQDRFDNVVDWIPWGDTGDRIDAPGNLGRGTVSGLEVVIRSPVPVAPGLAVTLSATLQRSKAIDPVTSAARSISEIAPVRVNAGIRQNFSSSKLALGADYSFRAASRTFRLAEIDRTRASPSLDVFVEIPLRSALKLRAQTSSLLGSPELRERTFFDPDRAHRFSGTERTRRDPGRWFVVTLSGSF